jgi:hypothetical protein
MASANAADFALFIFGPDDWTESRSIALASPRDNVVFEAGMFGAVLGWRRNIILHARDVKLPSDLWGLTNIPYDPAAEPAAEGRVIGAKIRRVINELGWRGSESLAGRMQGYWWQFTLSDAAHVEKSALALIEIRCANRCVHALQGKTWTAAGDLIAHFWSKATNVNEEARTLFYYWEGEWPGHLEAPQLFGKGEIVLSDAQRATGYFTVRSDDIRDVRERKSVVYRRALPAEIEVLQTSEPQRWKELIAKRLEERSQQTFAI